MSDPSHPYQPPPRYDPTPGYESPPPGYERPAEAAEPSGSTGVDTKLWLVRAAKALVFFIYAVVVVELVMLTLGFFLQLFGASTDATFTRWVYRNVDRAMDPFRGIFPTREVTEQSVLDASLLFAIVVYAIVGIALHALVTWLTGKVVSLRREQQALLRQQARQQALQAQQAQAQQAALRQARPAPGQAVGPLPPDRPVDSRWG